MLLTFSGCLNEEGFVSECYRDDGSTKTYKVLLHCVFAYLGKMLVAEVAISAGSATDFSL